MKTNNKGFSLVELIVVIAIMAILAAVAIPTFAGFITKANEAADEDFMKQVEYAIVLANAADPDFVLNSVVVSVDDDGAIETVKYTCNGAATLVNIPETALTGTTEADEIKDARAIIDWDYTFKAKAYKDKTVTLTIATGAFTVAE